MRLEYRLTPLATLDYKEALDYYKRNSINAARGFVAAFKDTMAKICDHPTRWPLSVGDYRELNMRNNYPFRIVFKANEAGTAIIVIRIYHHSRNPGTKYPA